MKTENFFKTVCNLAIPVALQSMLQSSFSMVDQIMIGQLGSVSIAGVGFAGKFGSILSVVLAAVGAVAGIMIAQYMGQDEEGEVRRSFFGNLILGIGIAGIFTVLCIAFPTKIMGFYTNDTKTRLAAGSYLRILSATYIPMACATMLSTLFRCMEKASYPLYASIFSAVANTVLNYVFIFGKCGLPAMGAEGAGIATAAAQWINFLVMLWLLVRQPEIKRNFGKTYEKSEQKTPFNWKQYGTMLLPMLICEVAWSLGENVYAAIYGHMGTLASAAMTLINPIQGLVIGALCGLSQAASVIVGKKLGKGEYEEAYESGKKLMWYGLVGSLLLSVLVFCISFSYVGIYQVEWEVKRLTMQILYAYALVAPLKVLNMILGGGIIRSGGKTNYVMVIDILGTWGFGVPLGLLAAFVWQLSIPYVYFILSLEEGVRLLISLVVFRKRKWMQSLSA